MKYSIPAAKPTILAAASALIAVATWYTLDAKAPLPAHFAALGLAAAQPQLDKDRPCAEFEEVWMTLERNATDGDTEVVLFAKGQDEGLERLVIFAPNGRRVADFKGDRRGVGIREFHLESAEPPDLEAATGCQLSIT